MILLGCSFERNLPDQKESKCIPYFIQFIDCIFQLKQQFPTVFEFNENFLLSILDHLYNRQFGTFLFKNGKERNDNQIQIKTISLWTFINDKINDYKNPFFKEENIIIYPICKISEIVFWKNYYLKWQRLQKNWVTIENESIELSKKYNRLQDSSDEIKNFLNSSSHKKIVNSNNQQSKNLEEVIINQANNINNSPKITQG